MHVMNWVVVRRGQRASIAEVRGNGDGGTARLRERVRARRGRERVSASESGGARRNIFAVHPSLTCGLDAVIWPLGGGRGLCEVGHDVSRFRPASAD